MPKRPDFIVFMTDQHRADYLGCAGHPILKTPHIDALAETGTLWNRFYVASPVCMPNRASFMTCRMPSSHGVRSNGIPLDTRHVTFVELLREAGYNTALIGKSHLQTFSGRPPAVKLPEARPGFHRATGPMKEAVRHNHSTYQAEQSLDEGGTAPLPYYGFDHVELVTRHGDNCGGHYRNWLLDKAPEADTLLGPANQLPHAYGLDQAVRTALPEDLYSTHYIAERASAWLADNADDERPIFLMVSFPDPHHPFNPPGRYWDMYAPEDMTVPKAFTANDWVPPPHVACVLEDREAGRADPTSFSVLGVSVREAQEAQALTCGMISMIDDAVGRVRSHKRAGQAVTVFTTDHGDHLGDHKMLFKGPAAYEELTRVPFIWSDPDAPIAQQSDAIGQTLDIGTTILARAKIEPAVGMQGKSLLNDHRDAALIEYNSHYVNRGLGTAPRVHTLRTEHWRLSLIDGVEWGEMYNLQDDPDEFYNLWDVPEHAAQRAALIEKLARLGIANVDRVPWPIAQA
ncbi:MAG: sulfatase-like hydrolase/transferase [Pseudomonadota bacterium]